MIKKNIISQDKNTRSLVKLGKVLLDFFTKMYAAKVQKKNLQFKQNLLKKQYQILLTLKQYPNYPQIFEYNQNNQQSYLIMQLLGQNLEQIRKKTTKSKFSLKTTTLIAIQAVKAIYALHSHNILHRDLKPENMLVGSKHQIKLIDYGLSRQANPLPPVASSLIGSARYASRGAHQGLSSKMDDLQSLFYVIIYLGQGILPWQIKPNNQQIVVDKKWSKVGEKKQMHSQQIVHLKDFNEKSEQKLWWTQLCNILDYIRGLQRNILPDYQKILRNLNKMLVRVSDYKKCFDWCKQNCQFNDIDKIWNVKTNIERKRHKIFN